MKPKPSTFVSTNPKPKPKSKSSNANANEEKHRQYPLQHLNLNPSSSSSTISTTRLRTNTIKPPPPGHSLRFSSFSSSPPPSITTSCKTKKLNLPSNYKKKLNSLPKCCNNSKKSRSTKPLPFKNSPACVTLTPTLPNKIPTTTAAFRWHSSKLSQVEAEVEGNDIKTPPVEASVSPELQSHLQCSTSTTPACYGTGHMLSGVSDKRKCRPRGLLAVTENALPLTSFDDNVNELASSFSVPLPVEASMHWLLSPTHRYHIPELCLDCHVPPLLSPHTHSCKPSLSKPQSHFPSHLHNIDHSPFSIHSSASGNVPLTPVSHSTSGGLTDFLSSSADNCNTDDLHSPITSIVESLQMSSLSPITAQPPIRDTDMNKERDSIALSFHFDSPTTSWGSAFVSHTHQIPDDHQASWNSCSTLGSESQMRISWTEGLMSQIDEMDEFDSCRCLSDDDEAANGCANDVFQLCETSDVDAANTCSDRILTKSDCCTAEILDGETGVEGKGQKNYPSRPPQLACSCAESISTDGGGLLASADSDWALCYNE